MFCAYGCYLERQVAIKLPGAAGMDRMREIMAGLRAELPAEFGGLPVRRARDYGQLKFLESGGRETPFQGEQGDLVIFDLIDPNSPSNQDSEHDFPPLGNAIAARPSGTEPKIKFYLFAFSPPMAAEKLPSVKRFLESRLDLLEKDLRRQVGV